MREGSEVPRAGQVVISTRGRDSGKFYLVVKALDPRHVALADGRSKTAEHPKRKNVRHLVVTPHLLPELVQRLERGEAVAGSEIQEALERIERLERGSQAGGEG